MDTLLPPLTGKTLKPWQSQWRHGSGSIIETERESSGRPSSSSPWGPQRLQLCSHLCQVHITLGVNFHSSLHLNTSNILYRIIVLFSPGLFRLAHIYGCVSLHKLAHSILLPFGSISLYWRKYPKSLFFFWVFGCGKIFDMSSSHCYSWNIIWSDTEFEGRKYYS